MKNNFCKKSLVVGFFLLPLLVTYSQTTVPFSTRYQNLVKGDLAVIANSIVDKVADPNSIIVHSKKQRHNDEFQMGYIDIDSDEATFSSSSASLQLLNQSSKKIIYAGLYWSATYKYNSGYFEKDGTITIDDKKRDAFDIIKIPEE